MLVHLNVYNTWIWYASQISYNCWITYLDPEEQNIVFNPNRLNLDADVQNAQRDTICTGVWFKFNEYNIDAQTISYNDIPKYYILITKSREWLPRQSGGETVIGRMYYSINLVSDPKRY